MRDLPHTTSRYDEWRDNVAEDEGQRLIDQDGRVTDIGIIEAWLQDSPALDEPAVAFWEIRDTVEKAVAFPLPDREISWPDDDPVEEVGESVRYAVLHDIACRIQEMVEQGDIA